MTINLLPNILKNCCPSGAKSLASVAPSSSTLRTFLLLGPSVDDADGDKEPGHLHTRHSKVEQDRSGSGGWLPAAEAGLDGHLGEQLHDDDDMMNLGREH